MPDVGFMPMTCVSTPWSLLDSLFNSKASESHLNAFGKSQRHSSASDVQTELSAFTSDWICSRRSASALRYNMIQLISYRLLCTPPLPQSTNQETSRGKSCVKHSLNTPTESAKKRWSCLVCLLPLPCNGLYKYPADPCGILVKLMKWGRGDWNLFRNRWRITKFEAEIDKKPMNIEICSQIWGCFCWEHAAPSL